MSKCTFKHMALLNKLFDKKFQRKIRHEKKDIKRIWNNYICSCENKERLAESLNLDTFNEDQVIILNQISKLISDELIETNLENRTIQNLATDCKRLNSSDLNEKILNVGIFAQAPVFKRLLQVLYELLKTQIGIIEYIKKNPHTYVKYSPQLKTLICETELNLFYRLNPYVSEIDPEDDKKFQSKVKSFIVNILSGAKVKNFKREKKPTSANLNNGREVYEEISQLADTKNLDLGDLIENKKFVIKIIKDLFPDKNKKGINNIYNAVLWVYENPVY